MTDQQHPITPPPELLQQWAVDYWGPGEIIGQGEKHIATQSARWGADQELEACCEWVANYCPYFGDYPMPEKKLRAARRPKPPSLKEQSLALIDKIQGNKDPWDIRDLDVVRRALEALDD